MARDRIGFVLAGGLLAAGLVAGCGSGGSAASTGGTTPATPTLTWARPAAIVQGTPLSGTQLNATASVAGTFTYAPPAGTVLGVGAGQVLSASFAPADPASYTSASATVSIDVLPTPPAPPPAPVVLSALPADGTVTLDWSPSAGATSYVVYGATVPGVTPSGYASLPGALRVVAASPPAVLSGLPNGVTHHLVVSALATSGASAESSEVTATPERDCACPGWQVCDSRRQCVAPARDGEYRVGLNYHALSDHWQVDMPVPPEVDVFLPNYHLPGIRDLVRAQLAVLAAGGARVLKTQIWHVNDPLTGPHSYGVDFPPTAQQLRNLRDYVTDVAGTPTPDGVPMELYLSNDWLGSADYREGTPETTLGSSRLTAAEFAARVEATVDSELAAVRGVYRPDGRPAVTLFYFKLEMVVCATLDDSDPACLWPGNSQPFHNMQWMMTTLYPHFVARARATGTIPSVYFLAGGHEPNYLDPSWIDPYYRELDGHASMSWFYRGLRFMREHGLPLPDRVDMTATCNSPPSYTTVATVIARIHDDLLAILPEFQAPPHRFAAAETFYYADDAFRAAGSAAFPSEALLGRGLEGVMPWPEIRPGVPHYDFRPFQAASMVTPFAALDPGFEDPGGGRGLPAGWSPDPPGPTVASRALVPDAHGGSAVLRLQGGACAGCGGAISDPVPVTPGKVALVRFWARSDVPVAGAHPPAADYAGMAIQVRGTSAGVDTGSLLDFGTVDTRGVWRRFVGAVEVPAGVDALRLRLVLQNAGGGSVEVDDLH